MSDTHVITASEQSAKQQRRLTVLDQLVDDLALQVALVDSSEPVTTDDAVGIPADWLEHPADELVWLPRAASALDIELDSDRYEVVATRLANQGLSGFATDSLTQQERQEAAEVAEAMEQVEKGDLVVWNGRSNAQTVTRHGGSWFEVEGSRGGHYRFKLGGEDQRPHLTNLNSGNDYDVDDFDVVGSSDSDD